MAKDAAKQSGASLTSFTDEVIASPLSAGPASHVRAQREISLALARLFNPTQEANKSDNHAALVKTISETTGASQQDADKMVSDWTASYEHLQSDLKAAKDQAAAKAREAAEKAAHDLAILSLCAFIAFAIGAVAAGCGGELGAKFTLKHTNDVLPV